MVHEILSSDIQDISVREVKAKEVGEECQIENDLRVAHRDHVSLL